VIEVCAPQVQLPAWRPRSGRRLWRDRNPRERISILRNK
jgi:hypothetical protein